jgi:hypothetical protein
MFFAAACPLGSGPWARHRAIGHCCSLPGSAPSSSAPGTWARARPVVPGLALAGAGLSLLVIPLANVVLAAVPSQAAGGASGLFSTAQQLGGALGVAMIGTIFFGQLGGHSFTQAFTHSLPVTAGLFLAAAVLSLMLPKTAVADEHG